MSLIRPPQFVREPDEKLAFYAAASVCNLLRYHMTPPEGDTIYFLQKNLSLEMFEEYVETLKCRIVYSTDSIEEDRIAYVYDPLDASDAKVYVRPMTDVYQTAYEFVSIMSREYLSGICEIPPTLLAFLNNEERNPGLGKAIAYFLWLYSTNMTGLF